VKDRVSTTRATDDEESQPGGDDGAQQLSRLG
jgi:hypothetical protein